MALVPGKPIIANRGIDYIPRLNSAPECTIKTNLRINYFLNLTHLARTINSLTGGKSLSKQTKWWNDCSPERKFQQREIDLEQLTDEEPGSRYIVQVWPRVNQISSRIPKVDLQRQTRRSHALSPTLASSRGVIFGTGRAPAEFRAD